MLKNSTCAPTTLDPHTHKLVTPHFIYPHSPKGYPSIGEPFQFWEKHL